MKGKKDLDYWRENAKEDYLTTPISVLRYITILEEDLENRMSTLKEEISPNEKKTYNLVADTKECKYI
jgi:hypothetical protein